MQKKLLPLWCMTQRPHEAVIDTIIIHSMTLPIYSKLVSEVDLAWCILKTEKLSVHYFISSNGKVYQFAEEKSNCFHAGKSIMPHPDCRKNVNDFSIGIELIENNKGQFSEYQYKALADLCLDITKRRGILFTSILGHSEISGEDAVKRRIRDLFEVKSDPGRSFDWEKLKSLFYSNNQKLYINLEEKNMETEGIKPPSIEELAAAYKKAMKSGDHALAGVIESAVLHTAIAGAGSHEAAILASFAFKASS